jgi:hypothetical protein
LSNALVHATKTTASLTSDVPCHSVRAYFLSGAAQFCIFFPENAFLTVTLSDLCCMWFEELLCGWKTSPFDFSSLVFSVHLKQESRENGFTFNLKAFLTAHRP